MAPCVVLCCVDKRCVSSHHARPMLVVLCVVCCVLCVVLRVMACTPCIADYNAACHKSRAACCGSRSEGLERTLQDCGLWVVCFMLLVLRAVDRRSRGVQMQLPGLPDDRLLPLTDEIFVGAGEVLAAEESPIDR